MSGSPRFTRLDLCVAERIATITLRVPAPGAALDRPTLDELDRAVARAAGDGAAGAILLAGDGPGAFAAGADLDEASPASPLVAAEISRQGQAVLARLERCGKPVLAAIDGAAHGRGCELALACHLRALSREATLGLPAVGLGLIPGHGGTQRLPRLVGRGRALELILTGDAVGAERALGLGLASLVLPAGDLLAGSRALLARILAGGPVAVRLALEAVLSGDDLPLDDGLFLESTLFGLAAATDDAREGLSAFLGQRKPAFQGR